MLSLAKSVALLFVLACLAEPGLMLYHKHDRNQDLLYQFSRDSIPAVVDSGHQR